MNSRHHGSHLAHCSCTWLNLSIRAIIHVDVASAASVVDGLVSAIGGRRARPGDAQSPVVAAPVIVSTVASWLQGRTRPRARGTPSAVGSKPHLIVAAHPRVGGCQVWCGGGEDEATCPV
eukprot:673993-Prymnesium_polylepis.2